MGALPKLERLSAPGEHLRARNGSSWLISGTYVRVVSNSKRWRLAAYREDPGSFHWLEDQGLDGATFPTRTQALKAYQAAASVDPPPSACRERVGSPRKVADGTYLVADVLIERSNGKSWRIIYPDGARANAPSLVACLRILRDPSNPNPMRLPEANIPEHLRPYVQDRTISRLQARARRGGRVGEACQVALDYLRSVG